MIELLTDILIDKCIQPFCQPVKPRITAEAPVPNACPPAYPGEVRPWVFCYFCSRWSINRLIFFVIEVHRKENPAWFFCTRYEFGDALVEHDIQSKIVEYPR
jgi:hypothetical protein